MSDTLDPESDTVPKVTLALETLFKRLDDGLKTNEESTNLVATLVEALGARYNTTETLYRESPTVESELAELYGETKVLIFKKLKIVVEKSVSASTKGRILSVNALTLCEMANQYPLDVPGYVTSMKEIADDAYNEASEAASAFRGIRVQAIAQKRQCHSSLKNISTESPHYEVLESLAVLLGVLAKGEDSSVKAKWTVLDRLVDWWHDIRVALGGVLTSLEHIRHGTAIQLKNIENTWRDLSNHYNRYTSQAQNALDSLKAHELGVTLRKGSHAIDGGTNTPGTSEDLVQELGSIGNEPPQVGSGSEAKKQGVPEAPSSQGAVESQVLPQVAPRPQGVTTEQDLQHQIILKPRDITPALGLPLAVKDKRQVPQRAAENPQKRGGFTWLCILTCGCCG